MEFSNMSNETIKPFLFDGEVTVRVIDRDGEPWFVAVDVCRALGLTNAAEAVRGLDDDERGISTTDTSAGSREVLVVAESGLYALIFKSRKPNAIKFRKWVTAEVLPSLRREGGYTVPTTAICGTIAKPWVDWTLEERRVALSEVNTARRVFNQSSAVWMWSHVGLPMPPRHLLPAWWQTDWLSPSSLPAN
jgi:prophage antirepressor-like protein